MSERECTCSPHGHTVSMGEIVEVGGPDPHPDCPACNPIHGEPTPESENPEPNAWDLLEEMEGIVDHLDTPTCGCPNCKPPETAVTEPVSGVDTTVERLETGPLQFGDDWPGIFIRGDQAFAWAMGVEAVEGQLEFSEQIGLNGLAETLHSCNVRSGVAPTTLPALTAIHKLQAELDRLATESIEQTTRIGELEVKLKEMTLYAHDMAEDGSHHETENERLRKALGESVLLGNIGYERRTKGNKDYCDTVDRILGALTGEQK